MEPNEKGEVGHQQWFTMMRNLKHCGLKIDSRDVDEFGVIWWRRQTIKLDIRQLYPQELHHFSLTRMQRVYLNNISTTKTCVRLLGVCVCASQHMRLPVCEHVSLHTYAFFDELCVCSVAKIQIKRHQRPLDQLMSLWESFTGHTFLPLSSGCQ